ncbi:MAG TPA: glycerol-3-phosphate dehydrogenase [Caldilineae bacterium]|nr:glycerol-3-phosphate dehydrogenase [Caldilineae bacterium]
MANVAIVGAGLMGTATAWPLSDNGHAVRLVGTHLDGDIIKSCKEERFHPRLKRQLPDGVQPYYVEEIAEALDGVDVIVSGVNSLGVHWIGRTIGPYLQPGQLIIAVTKGLEAAENGDLMILPDVLASELPEDIRSQVKLAAIGGPCIAGELAGRRQTCVVFGSRDRDAVERLAEIFRTPYYHVWTTTDLVGLEVCAALKNAYTLGVGLAAGLLEREGGPDVAGAHMYNLAAATFAQGCTEIDRMLQIVGGTRAFAYGLPTPGDLYVTCMGGRTVRLGRLLGMGHTFAEAREIMAGETLESAEIIRQMGMALPKLTERGIIGPDEFPLLRALIDIVVHGRPVNLPLDDFFRNTVPSLWHQPAS